MRTKSSLWHFVSLPSLRFQIAFFGLVGSLLSIAHSASALEVARVFVFPVGNEWKAPGEGNEYVVIGGYCVWDAAQGGYHTGVDLSNGQEGGAVKAIAVGDVVRKTTGYSGGWGNSIVIRHLLPNGEYWCSRYAHLQDNSITVNVGDLVQIGQTIGLVGSTGLSSQPHLHLQITEGPEDPAYIPNAPCAMYGYPDPLKFIRDRLAAPLATEPSTWGHVKSLYRQ
jgi:murein DD-endopeptidase MepM/ murein hydrolase activator NlpD